MAEAMVRVTGRLVFGVVVICLGVLFTLDNLGILEAHEVLRWWPAGLMAYGLMRVTGLFSRQNVTAGLIFTVIGGWLLLHRLSLVSLNPWELWPLLLVLIGASMVMGTLRRARGSLPGADSHANLSAFAMWSATERRVDAEDFQGGDVTAIMGGHDIDLRNARVPQGGRVVIDLLVWMGGVDFIVPEDWRVSAEGLVLMGAIEDHTKRAAGEPRATLVLRGLVLMGGVEVKNTP